MAKTERLAANDLELLRSAREGLRVAEALQEFVRQHISRVYSLSGEDQVREDGTIERGLAAAVIDPEAEWAARIPGDIRERMAQARARTEAQA